VGYELAAMKEHLAPWLRLAICFVVGAVVTFVVFAAGHQVIFSALCAIDGTLWAAWAQVLAISLTGGIGVTVAWVQLQRFNRNERAKTTVEYINVYVHGLNQIPGHEPITVARAVSYIEHALSDKELLDSLHVMAEKWYRAGGGKGFDGGDVEVKQYTLYDSAFVVAANFFMRAAGLDQKGLIEGGLLLDFYARQVVIVWDFILLLADVDPNALAFNENVTFKEFVLRARKTFVDSTAAPTPGTTYAP